MMKVRVKGLELWGGLYARRSDWLRLPAAGLSHGGCRCQTGGHKARRTAVAVLRFVRATATFKGS